MDSSSSDGLPSPKSLKSLACEMKYPRGNYLIHQFVLKSSSLRSESDIRAALRSFPGAWVNARNEDGFTALHLAVMKRNSIMVKMLLSSCMATIDVNAKCKNWGATALHFAAVKNYYHFSISNAKNFYFKMEYDKDVKEECLEIINVLLASGAVIDIEDDWGITPLHVAAKENEIDIIKLLISNGADMNIKDDDGQTPLHHAIEVSGLETVKLLISNGAELNIKDEEGKTPFHYGIRESGLEAVKLLLESGANINEKSYWGYTPFHSDCAIIVNHLHLCLKKYRQNNPQDKV